MRQNELHTAAFTLQPLLKGTSLSLAGLPFPDAWRSLFLELQAELRNRKDLPNTLPTVSLNNVLKVLVPHLLAMPTRVNLEDDRYPAGTQPIPWLLAEAPLPCAPLHLVMSAWLEQNYRTCAAYETVQRGLRRDDLVWQKFAWPLDFGVEDNGTARVPPLAFAALPALLADRLVQRRTRIQVGSEIRELKRCPSSRGATLVSWPPVYYSKKDERWGYSYSVTITVQTLVGDPRPRLHFHFGVRRWASQPVWSKDALFLTKEARNVYLYSSAPWLGLPATDSFAVAHLVARYEENVRVPAWDDLVPQIAQRLQVPFPSAGDLAKDPFMWLQGQQGVFAAMVEGKRSIHPVAPGLGLEVHEAMTDQIAAALAPELELCPPLRRVRSVVKTEKHTLMAELRNASEELRLEGLEVSVGSQVTIEIYWLTFEARDMLVNRLLALLRGTRAPLIPVTVTPTSSNQTEEEVAIPSDASLTPQVPFRARTPKRTEEPKPDTAPDEIEILLPGGGRLRVIMRQLGGLASPFEPTEDKPTTQRQKREFMKQQTERRSREIQKEISAAEEPTLALVELPHYQEDAKVKRDLGWRDPKDAIRLGMARAGRVTKFTSGKAEELRERCEGAVRDGLRQLGYLPAPIGYKSRSGSLPEDLVVAGVWQIRLNQASAHYGVYVPVVVLMHTAVNKIRAWLPDGKRSRPYCEALRDITVLSAEEVSHAQQATMLKRLRQFLENELFEEGAEDVLILASAQNVRTLWPGIGNAYAAWNGIRFARNENPVLLNQVRGKLRLIRLRTNDMYETPEWFTRPAEPGKGYTNGIFKDAASCNLFYNPGPKPHTQAKKRKGKRLDPSEYIALPSLLEIVPLVLQPGDDVEVWVSAIDQWRRMANVVTNEHLLLPIQMAYARKMKQYAALIGYREQEEDGDDDNEDEPIIE